MRKLNKLTCIVLTLTIILSMFIVGVIVTKGETTSEIVIGGKTYNAKVGDKFTYDYYLNVTNATKGLPWEGYILGLDTTLAYNTDVLQLTNWKTQRDNKKVVPNISSSTCGLEEGAGFNIVASDISGMDFSTDDSVLIHAELEVKAKGNSKVENVFTQMYSASDEEGAKFFDIVKEKKIIHTFDHSEDVVYTPIPVTQATTESSSQSTTTATQPTQSTSIPTTQPTQPTTVPTTQPTSQEPTQKDPSKAYITMDGVEHIYNVGDKFSYKYCLNVSEFTKDYYVPGYLNNYQGSIYFDANMVVCTNFDESNKKRMFPITENPVMNKLSNEITFNGSDLGGWEFDDNNCIFLIANFTVTAPGTSEVRLHMEKACVIDDDENIVDVIVDDKYEKGVYHNVEVVNGEMPVTDISFSTTSIEMYVGKTKPFSYEYEPVYTTDILTKTLGDNTIVEYQEKQKRFKGNKRGQTTFTLSTSSGKSEVCNIKIMDLSDATVTLDKSSFTYSGQECKPNVTSVKCAGVTLKEGTDFTVSYKDNVNAGKGYVVLTDAKDKSIVCNVPFTINSKDASSAVLELDKYKFDYTGKEIIPQETVTIDGKQLFKNIDYTMEYTNNVYVGTATAKAVFTKNYKGSKSINFIISGMSIAEAEAKVDDQTFVSIKTALKPIPSLKLNGKDLVADVDFEVVGYLNNNKVGKGIINVNGLGDYVGTKVIEFNILPRDISTLAIELTKEFSTGIKPACEFIIYNKTDKLVSDTDYIYTYTELSSDKTCKLVITGKGNYTGTKEAVNIRLCPIGDVDFDQQISVKDSTYIQQHLAKSLMFPEGSAAFYTGDIDKDNELTVKDSTYIQQHLAKSAAVQKYFSNPEDGAYFYTPVN